jgi:iron(III) transport system substrate-binding protein
VATAQAQSVAAGGKAEWERLIAAAKAEGKVLLAGPPAQQYREGLMAFQKAFPEIKIEYVAASGRDFGPRILREREVGQFLWDVHVGGPETANLQLKPAGVFDPLMSALILQEVLEDDVWVGGFADGWMEREKRFIYAFSGRVSPQVHVNWDAVSEKDLRRVEDLLDPKWRGKITWNDPRAAGSGGAIAGYWLHLLGEDFLRGLLKQDMVAARDLRQQVEWIVRGKYPVAIGLDDRFLLEFKEKGVGSKVRPLAAASPAGGGARIGPGFGNIMSVNRAPHPNAAKVYINWLLSREGQVAYVKATGINSRRLDVTEGPAETAPRRGVKYFNINKEENQPNIQKATEIAKEILQ